MVNRDFFKSRKYTDQKHRANREGADPDILEFEKRYIARFKRLNIPMFTVYCVRSAREQDKLYKDGFTNARAGNSPHNYGMAVDIAHSTMAYKEPALFHEIMGNIGNEISVQAGIPIRWGGKFTSLNDPWHFELADWRQRAAL